MEFFVLKLTAKTYYKEGMIATDLLPLNPLLKCKFQFCRSVSNLKVPAYFRQQSL